MAIQRKPGLRGQGTIAKRSEFFREQDKALRKRGLNPFTKKKRDTGVTKEKRRQPPRAFQRTRTF
jgi:hypothetical protein